MKRWFPYLQLRLVFFSLVIVSVLVGCGGREDSSTAEYDTGYSRAEYSSDDAGGFNEVAEEGSYGDGADMAYTESPSSSENKTVSIDQQPDRMVIYNAEMSIEVNDYQQTQNNITAKAQELGGFVVQSSLHHRDDNETFGSLVVRVPQSKFHDFLNDLESYSTKVIERNVTGNDVTEEYVDIESRLRSKRKVEERLLAFMEDASNTEDLLKISSDLARVQEEIEQLTGRMKYLENNVSFSTVTVYIHERNVVVPNIQNSDSLNTWENSKSLFMSTVNVIISFFSGVVVLVIGLSPVLLPLLILTGVFYTVYKRRNSKKDLSE